MQKLNRPDKFRTVRISYSNLDFMDEISKKRSYDKILTELIAISKPILLKETAN